MNKIATLLFLLLLAGCKDDSPNFLCEGILYDKSLAHIKHCVEGEWQHHLSRGGFTGNQVYYYTDAFMTIRNDSIKWNIGDSQIANAKIEWALHRSVFGHETYLMSSKTLGSLEVRGFRADSLILRDNANDGFGHLFTKISSN